MRKSKLLGLKLYVKRYGKVMKHFAEVRFGNDTVKSALSDKLFIEKKINDSRFLVWGI